MIKTPNFVLLVSFVVIESGGIYQVIHTKAERSNKHRGAPDWTAPYGKDRSGKLSRTTRQGFFQLALKFFLSVFTAVFVLALKDFAGRRQLFTNAR